MSNFLLNSSSQKKDILKMQITKSYTFNPKKEIIKGTKLRQVTIYDESKIEKIVMHNYKIKYQRILKIIGDLSNSDDSSESDYLICLGEIQRLKDILNFKYKKYLKREVYKYFLENIMFFEKILNEKIREYQEVLSEMKGR